MNLKLSVKLSELPDYPAFDFRVTLADGPCGGYHSNEVSLVGNYVYTFEGQGPYDLDCTALDGVLNLDWLSPLYTLPTEINTFDLQQTGNTSMQYEVRVRAQ